MLKNITTSVAALTVLAILASIGWASVAEATTQVLTDSKAGDNVNPLTTYAVSSSDLINGESPAASSTPADFAIAGASGLSVLTDGAFPAMNPGSEADFASAGPGLDDPDYVTYSLGSDPRGYTITSIATYGGWADAGRDGQGYTVAYSTTSATGPFTTIAVVDYDPTFGDNGDQVASQVIVDDEGGAPLTMGATYIRFTFDQPVPNSWGGMSELDVFGVATPEPASLGLLVLGGAALLRRRRAA